MKARVYCYTRLVVVLSIFGSKVGTTLSSRPNSSDHQVNV